MDIKVYYIVDTHTEDNHDNYEENTIPLYLDKLSKNELPDGLRDWAEYDEHDTTMNVTEPLGYCVYFKIVENDGNGNHKTYYDYFSVHIAHEQLKIKLSDEARKGFEKSVEYGDVAHTQESLKNSVIDGIEIITDNDNADRTEDFKRERDLFTFYFREDRVGGQRYSVESDGIEDSDGNKIDNLPLGTYLLFVVYNGNKAGSRCASRLNGKAADRALPLPRERLQSD